MRPLLDKDYLAVYENMQDKNINLYTGVPYPYGQIEAKYFIKAAQENWEKRLSREFAIIEQDTGLLAGTIGLKFRHKRGPIGEIGYWLGVKFRGKGLMREAFALMVEYAFEKKNLDKVFGRVFTPNRSSARLFEKMSFQLEGRLRRHAYHLGQIFDVNMYGLLKEEYKSHKQAK